MIHVANGVTSGRMRGAYDNAVFYAGDACSRSGKSVNDFVLLYRGDPESFDDIEVYPVPE